MLSWEFKYPNNEWFVFKFISNWWTTVLIPEVSVIGSWILYTKILPTSSILILLASRG